MNTALTLSKAVVYSIVNEAQLEVTKANVYSLEAAAPGITVSKIDIEALEAATDLVVSKTDILSVEASTQLDVTKANILEVEASNELSSSKVDILSIEAAHDLVVSKVNLYVVFDEGPQKSAYRYVSINVGNDPVSGLDIYAVDCCAPLLGRYLGWFVGVDPVSGLDIYSRFNTELFGLMNFGGISQGIDPASGQTIYAVAPCLNCGTISTSCCTNLFPEILFATLTSLSGCACADGVIVPLIYNPGTSKWEGTATLGTCGRNITIAFYCSGVLPDTLVIDVSFSDACRTPLISYSPVPGVSCDPIYALYTFVMPNVCGCDITGDLQLEITV